MALVVGCGRSPHTQAREEGFEYFVRNSTNSTRRLSLGFKRSGWNRDPSQAGQGRGGQQEPWVPAPAPHCPLNAVGSVTPNLEITKIREHWSGGGSCSLGRPRDESGGEVKEVPVDFAQIPHLIFQLCHPDAQLVLAAQYTLEKGFGGDWEWAPEQEGAPNMQS